MDSGFGIGDASTWQHFIEHREDSGASYSTAGKPKGSTLYDAISRPVIGDPKEAHHIRNAVLRHAFRVRANPKHPQHEEYLSLEQSFYEQTGWELIYGSISLEGKVTDHVCTAGPQNGQQCMVLRRMSQCGSSYLFSSLLPDTSGKALMDRLLDLKAQKYGGLPMGQLSWACKPLSSLEGAPQKPEIICYNEFNPDSRLEDLIGTDPATRLDTVKAIVSKPSQIQPAIDLFFEAVKMAPNQGTRVKVTQACQPGNMNSHVAMDNEFVIVPRQLAEGLSSHEAGQLIERGRAEHLCSVLQIGVGQHFTLDINFLHMLENAEPETVPELCLLLEKIFFNKDIAKVWWNPQRDVQVLDDTIAYMFQGTRRDPYTCTRYSGGSTFSVPQFFFTNQYLQGVRPSNLTFPRLPPEKQHCDLHLPGNNEHGLSCPCSLGFIDIAALYNHVCRQHGLDAPKMPWHQCKHGRSYDNFLAYTLQDDRLEMIARGLKGKKTLDFFQRLGVPDKEKDDEAMGYGTVDVLCTNRVLEQLLASDDRQFVAGVLADYHYSDGDKLAGHSKPRTVPQRRSPLDSSRSTSRFEDNPLLFSRKTLPQAAPSQLSSMFTTDARLFATETLTPWEHDERVEVSRKIAGFQNDTKCLKQNNPHEGLSADADHNNDERQKEVLKHLTDPCRNWFPITMATAMPPEYDAPIVKAIETHTEALVQFLRSPAAEFAMPPGGFGAACGTDCGLPSWNNRIPGQGLYGARNLFEAFQKKDGESGILFGEPAFLPIREPKSQKPRITIVKMAQHAVLEKKAIFQDTSAARDAAEFDYAQRVEREHIKNQEHGLPSFADPKDVFDPEGREWRRRVENAPEWNRRDVLYTPPTYEDGTWKSVATETLAALRDESLAETLNNMNLYGVKKGKKKWHGRSDSGIGLR